MTSPLTEMFWRYGASLWDNAPLAVSVAGLALLLCRPRLQAAMARWPAYTLNGWLALAVALGVVYGFELAWLGDDAFISFRYADNLARGNGLVFNPGERVEGYTNFLWTVLMAGFIRIGADPGQASIVVSLASFAALIAVTRQIRRRAAPGEEAGVLPLAALLLAVQYSMASFATSGLETMFAALMVALSLERALARSPLAAGAAGIAATLCHPDHGLLYASLGVALLLEPERRRDLVRYAIPFFAVYVPYFVWRWSWYGDLFPNTYYAKSADLSYFNQGGLYIASFVIGSGLFAAVPLFGFSLARLRGNLLARYLAIAVPVFCLYVAKIGGDFMYGRLLIPLVAPLLVLGEIGVRTLLAEQRTGWASAALASLALCAVPTQLLASGEKRWHLSDERSFYPLITFSPLNVQSRYFRSARRLREHFVDRGFEPMLALQCVGTVGYYTGLPIVDTLGITDRTVAHTAVTKRGRPGHEKQAPISYLVDRGVALADAPLYPPPYAETTRLSLGRFDYWFARYDPALAGLSAGRPDVTQTDFDADRAARIARLRRLRRGDEAACDAWFVDEFYFGGAARDSAEGRPVTRALLAASASTAHPIAAAALDGFDYERTHRGVPQSPAIFPDLSAAEWPVSTRSAGEGEHAPTIDLRSKPFRIEGDVLELGISGGRQRDNLNISLWVEGTRVLTTTACASDLPSRRLFHTTPYQGRTATLHLHDSASTPPSRITLHHLTTWTQLK